MEFVTYTGKVLVILHICNCFHLDYIVIITKAFLSMHTDTTQKSAYSTENFQKNPIEYAPYRAYLRVFAKFWRIFTIPLVQIYGNSTIYVHNSPD